MSLPAIHVHLALDDDEVSFPNITDDPSTPSLFDLNSPTKPQHSFTQDQDQFRPTHLLPPPSTSPRLPMDRPSLPADKKGIDQARFEQLLKSSRERTAMTFSKRKEPVELRKQVTIKAHKSKAVERRALFLSRIDALPSIAATQTPVTPPESPAVFHFTLPSPGLQSPLALFESLSMKAKSRKADASNQDKRATWVEEIDFKERVRQSENPTCERDEGNVLIVDAQPLVKPQPKRPYDASRDFTKRPNINLARRTSTIPSLDQISARLASAVAHKFVVHPPVPALVADNDSDSDVSSEGESHLMPVPLSPRICVTPPPEDTSVGTSPPRASRPPIPLPAFLVTRRRTTGSAPVAEESVSVSPRPCKTPPPAMAPFPVSSSPSPPRLQLCPRPNNLPLPSIPVSQPFMAQPTTTSLRMPSRGVPSAESRTQKGREMVERLRRRSSPADLPQRKDMNEHYVLAMKGGF